VSWFSKKKNFVSLSTAEAEYIAARSSCSQLVWMKQMLEEYDVKQGVLTLYCDNIRLLTSQRTIYNIAGQSTFTFDITLSGILLKKRL